MSKEWERFVDENGSILRHISMADFNYSINISLQFNYIFVETPKVGCSSLKSTLQNMELGDTSFANEEVHDIHNRVFSPLLSPAQAGSFKRLLQRKDIIKFCFVRNPYSRLLSSYLDKIEGNQPQKRDILMQLGKNHSHLSTKVSFDEFVQVVCEQPIAVMNHHWKTQYYLTFQDTIKYDFIGKLESFKTDIDQILGQINPNYKKFWHSEENHQTKANDMLAEYYSSQLKKMVYDKFKIDFDTFGYSPELHHQQSIKKRSFISKLSLKKY